MNFAVQAQGNQVNTRLLFLLLNEFLKKAVLLHIRYEEKKFIFKFIPEFSPISKKDRVLKIIKGHF